MHCPALLPIGQKVSCGAPPNHPTTCPQERARRRHRPCSWLQYAKLAELGQAHQPLQQRQCCGGAICLHTQGSALGHSPFRVAACHDSWALSIRGASRAGATWSGLHVVRRTLRHAAHCWCIIMSCYFCPRQIFQIGPICHRQEYRWLPVFCLWQENQLWNPGVGDAGTPASVESRSHFLDQCGRGTAGMQYRRWVGACG